MAPPSQAHIAKPTLTSVTSKGQATIPAAMRRLAGIEPGDEVRFSFEEGRIVIEKPRPIDDAWNAGQSAMLGEWDDPAMDACNDL